MGDTELAISEVVKGSVGDLGFVLDASHQTLIDAAAKLPQLYVSRDAVIEVLRGWRNGRYVGADVQRWASFIQKGFAPGNKDGPVRPIDIAYVADSEEVIAEILTRLSEIGDVVDGVVGSEEIEHMFNELKAEDR